MYPTSLDTMLASNDAHEYNKSSLAHFCLNPASLPSLYTKREIRV